MTETTAPAPVVTPTLDNLLEWAEAEHAKQLAGKPSEWDQGHWAVDVARYNAWMGTNIPVPVDCGTACCLAGKTVAWMGGKFLVNDEDGAASYAKMPSGEIVMVEALAEQTLGLTSAQADALFDGDNKIENVRYVVQQIKDGIEYPERYEGQSDEEDDYFW